MKRGSHNIALFLIYLIIMPVMYTSNALAYFVAEPSGYDRISGFRRMGDDVTIINVTAEIPGESISSSQVKLISDPTRPFECNSTGAVGPIYCEMTVPGVLPPGPHFYEVQLFNADLSAAEPKIPLTIYVDSIPPKVHSFVLSRNSSDVIADYQLSDSACDACSPDICAGISRVEFSLNYEKIGEVLPDRPCLMPRNSTSLTIPPTTGTKTKRLCIDVYDAVGQKSSECREIVMDFSPPKIINASLWFGGRPLRHTKGEPVGNVQLQVVLFEESDLNVSSLIADLSALNSRAEYSNAYKNIDMSDTNRMLFSARCDKLPNNLYNCSWSNLLMILPSTATPEIRLSVLDNLTNRMNETYTLPIVFDNTKPSVTKIRSGIADDRGRYWVGAGNNTVYVDITESGSGFYEKQLFLDVGSFGRQPAPRSSAILAPSNCTEGWTCVFPYLNVVNTVPSGTVLSVSLLGTSKDDAGNFVEGSTIAGFYYDNDAPQILSIQNSSVCPTAPNDIEIAMNVSERYSGGVKVIFSAPNISSASFPKTVDCEETTTVGIWTCDIVFGDLVSIYADGSINITLEDRAGNRNTTVLRQEVCESAPGVPPNVVHRVDHVDIFPALGIDRLVAGKMPFPLFWRPKPGFDSGTAQIQDIKIDSCALSAGDASELRIVTPLNMQDTLFGMMVSLPADFLSVAGEHNESLEVTCKLSMVIRSGQRVYQEPETEEVVFDVPLYNTVIGELNESMMRKFLAINRSISDKESEISDLEDDVGWATWFCSIAEVIMKLMLVLQVLKVVLYAVGWVVFAVMSILTWGDVDSAYDSGGTLYYTPCKVADYLTTTFITVLWQVDLNPYDPTTSYSSFFSPGTYFKIFCAFATCRFTETNNWIELVGGMGQTDTGMFTGHVDGADINSTRNSFSRQDISVDMDRGDAWETVVWQGDNVFSAYRSYPIAEYSLCGPGMLYGKKKERQIMCMHRNCYRDLVSAGFSPEICDRMYQARECLYVEGAVSQVVTDAAANKIWAGIIEWLMNQAAIAGMGLGSRNLGCPYPVDAEGLSDSYDTADKNCGSETKTALLQGYPALYCGALIDAMIYFDIGDWLSWDDFSNVYDESLGNPDYCTM